MDEPSPPLFSFARSFFHLSSIGTLGQSTFQALEAADLGQLRKLAALFARLQRAAILEALSVDADAEVAQERRLTSAVIESLTAKFNKRREDKDTEFRRVNDLAARLRGRTRKALEETLCELKGPISQLAEPKIHMTEGGPDCQNAHWYKFEVVQSANEAGKYANFEEDHYFVKASMRVDRERLIFVTSFHHVGRELSRNNGSYRVRAAPVIRGI